MASQRATALILAGGLLLHGPLLHGPLADVAHSGDIGAATPSYAGRSAVPSGTASRDSVVTPHAPTARVEVSMRYAPIDAADRSGGPWTPAAMPGSAMSKVLPSPPRDSDPLPKGHMLWDVSCARTSLCVAVGEGSTILTSADGGVSWTRRAPGTSNNLNGVSCPRASNCVAVGVRGAVLTSADGGTSWTLHSSSMDTVLNGVSCPSVNACVAAGGSNQVGAILTSADGGANWVRRASGAQ